MKATEDLTQKINELEAQLEASPIYRDLQVLKRARDIISSPSNSRKTEKLTLPPTKDRAEKESSAPINAAIEKHFSSTQNKPLTIDELHDALISRGIVVHGKSPKSTLATIVRWNPNLKNENKKWNLNK